MFRPYRSQISYVRDNKVSDYGSGLSIGGEIQVGNAVKGGIDIKVSPSSSTVRAWKNKNFALPNFTEKATDKNNLAYEPVYYKMVGELDVDREASIFNTTLKGNQAIKLKLDGTYRNRKLLPIYEAKDGTTVAIGGKIKRTKRHLRN